MLRFIHSDFELDLTYLKVSFTDENQRFQDTLTKEITFPFDIDLHSDFVMLSGFSNHYNVQGNKTIFIGHLDRDGEIVRCALKIQQAKGHLASAIITTETNELTSFDKKLNELPLETAIVNDIVATAVSVIEKAYPETNYNFPMVHTDKYDPSSAEWNGFEKVINRYQEGVFVSSAIDEEFNIDIIRNIMQPLPYLMHILKVGFLESNLELAGDILEDQLLQKALMFRDGSYFKRLSAEAIPFRLENDEWQEEIYVRNGVTHVLFYKEITIERKGEYNVFGDIKSASYRATPFDEWGTDVKILLRKLSGSEEEILLDFNQAAPNFPPEVLENQITMFLKMRTHEIDELLSFEVGDKLAITKVEMRRNTLPPLTPDYPETCSLELLPVRYREADGTPILMVQNLNEIDLKRVVPEMTFRDLVTVLKNWFNYDFVPEAGLAIMNKIGPQLDRSGAADLSHLDIEEPMRTFHEDRTFELLFADGKSDENYKYDSIFVNAQGAVVNDYIKKDSTKQISIDALPLPIATRGSISTAHAFTDETSKLRILFYDPIIEGASPVAHEEPDALIPKVYENCFSDWLYFRTNSVGYEWDFVESVERFAGVSVNTMIYAFSNFHLFTEMERERVDPLFWRVTAKSESLP